MRPVPPWRGSHLPRTTAVLSVAHPPAGSPTRRRACGQHVVMARDRDGKLPDQHAKFADLADDGLNAVAARRLSRRHPTLDGGQPASEFGDLAREVSGAARQIGDLAAHIGTVAQPHRNRVVENEEGQRGERHDRRLGAADPGHRKQDQAERCGDQHHADGDENRGNANHVARAAPPERHDLSINVDSSS